MNRRQFIESNGATCRNWRWSWAFVNHAERIVIFGAWDVTSNGGAAVILDRQWKRSAKTDRISPAYGEAESYVDLVATKGYSLKTFPMGHALADTSDPKGPSRIEGFQPILSDAELLVRNGQWIALPADDFVAMPEEVVPPLGTAFFEGHRRAIFVDVIERNGRARAECLRLHGCACKVCGLDFFEMYGPIGLGFIHVHHVYPLAGSNGENQVNPETDLVPVCPNCHAMLHRHKPLCSVDDLRATIKPPVDCSQ